MDFECNVNCESCEFLRVDDLGNATCSKVNSGFKCISAYAEPPVSYEDRFGFCNEWIPSRELIENAKRYRNACF